MIPRSLLPLCRPWSVGWLTGRLQIKDRDGRRSYANQCLKAANRADTLMPFSRFVPFALPS